MAHPADRWLQRGTFPAPVSAVAAGPEADRRHSARLDVLDQLDGAVVMSNVPVRLRDISLRGLATESPLPFPVGSQHLLRLKTPAGVEVFIRGQVMHHHTSTGPQGTPVFVTGFAFVNEGPQTRETVQLLLRAVSAELLQ